MARQKNGQRHPLLLYQRMMDRMWVAALPFGVLLAALWWWSGFLFPALPFTYQYILLIGALICLGLAIFTIVARQLAFVQVRTDHLRIATPFLQLKLSYRRLRSVHSTEFNQIFPHAKASWATRSFLSPFFGSTVVVLELLDYPMPIGFLRLFLAPQMFSPQTQALVLVVKDWMTLSTEIDDFQAKWLQTKFKGPVTNSPYGLLSSLKGKK